ncbi:sigma-54 dependent transcriptional regulator [Aliiglaciecola sp. CAU 1673]|uniref:sigma-54 interaction domain-containing protein n=1 Tax=Aliiglaciecola sp. CAU 1673 TaxID=3032595 RepID=UPI0023DCAFCF|nr:sigma-54 dependent transcriptional regulator [Aliiglaciecola sp. CAU 1673]MDF2177361.1 sigma-54 dependent transcriptional regulator [Aliiglaciecola sp. CAU 1673]
MSQASAVENSSSKPGHSSLGQEVCLSKQLMATLNQLNIIGRSPAFLDCLQRVRKFCRSQAPILLEGETGSGKELAARALHYLGPRQDKPFIPVNCGAIPEAMFENELFGHRQGAYTDAKHSQAGLVEQADGGTLFLDEIDSLPFKCQVALLRYLQDQKYRPLGAQVQRQSDINILSATNTDLTALASSGQFREDLLFRLRVISIRIPPLRERGDDALLLAEHFLRQFEHQYQQGQKTLSAKAKHKLCHYAWPGNIRELHNLLHTEYLLCEEDCIDLNQLNAGSADDSPLVSLGQDSYQIPYSKLREQVLEEFERQYLQQLMLKTRGNISAAARLVEKERRSLGRLLDKHGIDKRDYWQD